MYFLLMPLLHIGEPVQYTFSFRTSVFDTYIASVIFEVCCCYTGNFAVQASCATQTELAKQKKSNI